MTTKQEYVDARKRMEEAHDRRTVAARAYFEEGCKEMFATHPEMESFAWDQYTPWWNDGDVCEFGAHIGDPEINGKEVCEEEWNNKTGKYEDTNDPLAPACKSVREFLERFSGSDYEEMFGDHVKVTVTRAGASTEEYEHD